MNTCMEVGEVTMVPMPGNHKTPDSPARHFVTEHQDDLDTFLRTMETIKAGTSIHRRAQITHCNKQISDGRTATFTITIEGLSPDETTDAALILVQRTCRQLAPMSADVIESAMCVHSELSIRDLMHG